MPLEATSFAPYQLPESLSPAQGARISSEFAAEPLLVAAGTALPPGLPVRTMALVPSGLAAAPEEACLALDGTPAGGGAASACSSSERNRLHVAEATAAALAAGFAGVCLDRPDGPLALGLLGAGFCPECRVAFHRALVRDFGDQLAPFDYAHLFREALAQAPGALDFEQLPFGREFWRFRHDSLVRAVAEQARDARDAARAAGHALDVAARFEAIGPAQFGAARHVDAAVFPAAAGGRMAGTGTFRLLRAVMGRRPCAVEAPAGAPADGLARLAVAGAALGIELAGLDGEALRSLAGVRRFAQALGARREAPTTGSPVVECAVLYSQDSDLWTAGRHRVAVEEAGEALAALHVQAPVVLRVADAPPSAALVLAETRALAAVEIQAVVRRLEAGGSVLTFGRVSAADASGRPAHHDALPEGKPGGVRVGKGTLVSFPTLAPRPSTGLAPGPTSLDPISRALSLLLGKGRRAASVVARSPVQVALYQDDSTLEAHVVSLSGEPVRGATLFLGSHVAGSVKWARFQSVDGTDDRIAMNPSGYSLSTVLPAFRGYAVLSLSA